MNVNMFIFILEVYPPRCATIVFIIIIHGKKGILSRRSCCVCLFQVHLVIIYTKMQWICSLNCNELPLQVLDGIHSY